MNNFLKALEKFSANIKKSNLPSLKTQAIPEEDKKTLLKSKKEQNDNDKLPKEVQEFIDRTEKEMEEIVSNRSNSEPSTDLESVKKAAKILSAKTTAGTWKDHASAKI